MCVSDTHDIDKISYYTDYREQLYRNRRLASLAVGDIL